MKIDPNQVHMAPFGLILNQNRSHMVWDASYMPPVPQNPLKIQKSTKYVNFHIAPYLGAP